MDRVKRQGGGLMTTSKEPYDPQPQIVDQFRWAVRNYCERKNSLDEKKFYVLARYFEKELEKYIYLK